MSDQTAAELERDAEAARAQVASTAESIKSKMSPGQLIDEFAGVFSGGDGPGILANLKSQVRDNPLAVSLIGAGLAWLMVGQSASSTASGAWDEAKRKASNRSPTVPDYDETGDSSLWSSTKEVATSAAQAGSDALRSVKDMAGNRVGDAAQGATAVASQARQKLGTVPQEPLVLAAVGFALGAAIGGLLPHTDLEDQMIGSLGDKVMGTAEDLVTRGVEAGKQVATDAFDAAKNEADRQGLVSGDGTIVDQLTEVAKAAVTTAEDSVRGKLD